MKNRIEGVVDEAKSRVLQKKKDWDFEKKLKSENENKENDKLDLDDELQKSIIIYNNTFTIMNDNGMGLYHQRERSVDVICFIEDLINSIANHPKSFDRDISEIQMHRRNFINAIDYAESELKAAKKTAAGAGTGIAAGTAVASLAPSAAIWVATTLGTASTGTAISALSGAAAANAALAWLGGGTLALGGGGMAAGNAILALAGPIGWTIAGASILTSVLLFANNKKKSKESKYEEIKEIKINTGLLKEVDLKIEKLLDKTLVMREELANLYSSSLLHYGSNFIDISEEQQLRLGALVNNTKSLAILLSQNIEEKE